MKTNFSQKDLASLSSLQFLPGFVAFTCLGFFAEFSHLGLPRQKIESDTTSGKVKLEKATQINTTRSLIRDKRAFPEMGV